MVFFKYASKYSALFLISSTVLAQVNADSPCGSSANLLSLIDRPTAAVSACTVPEKNIVVESGYQYTQLIGSGVMHNLPETEIRFGLADNFEFVIYPSNYYNQSIVPRVGFGPTSLAVKHILASGSKWVASLELYTTLPSGSAFWGSQGTGGDVSGLLTYNVTDEINMLGEFGVSSTSLPVNYGGTSYKSFNSDVVLSWNKDKLSFYAEVYGQSKTSPDDGSGYNGDFGIIYLLRKNIAVDVEVGQRLSGAFGGFDTYFGTGISIQFG